MYNYVRRSDRGSDHAIVKAIRAYTVPVGSKYIIVSCLLGCVSALSHGLCLILWTHALKSCYIIIWLRSLVAIIIELIINNVSL